MEQTLTNNLQFVGKLREKMRKHSFMLSYRGYFSQDITRALLNVAERKLDLDGTERGVKKKVFNVMVECLQNICKHSDINPHEETGLFMIGKTGNDYVVYSGNTILNDKVDALRNKLLELNTLSLDEIKEMYKFLISSTDFMSGGGAGLGLIDIAKKSGNKLDFDFEKVDDNYSFFSLRTVVTKVQ